MEVLHGWEGARAGARAGWQEGVGGIPSSPLSAGVGADTIALRVSAKRKADVLEGKANDTQASTNTDTLRL